VPNDVKLEDNKNYLSWSRQVRVFLGGKQVEHYLEEDCVEPVDKLRKMEDMSCYKLYNCDIIVGINFSID
jgi:hypothetical protein